MINNRIQNTFHNLKKSKKKALITFVTGCDPDYNTSKKIFNFGSIRLFQDNPLIEWNKKIFE